MGITSLKWKSRPEIIFMMIITQLLCHSHTASSVQNKQMSNSVLTGDNDLYLGHGIYLHRLNTTSNTSQWQVNNDDIPKLYRLGFPAAGPTTKHNSDNNHSAVPTSSTTSVQPWILGLAAFVGCLVIMVLITIAVLARRWMIKSWLTRSTIRGNRRRSNDDLDDLVVIEANLDSPKITGNCDDNTLNPSQVPYVIDNRTTSLIAPGVLINQDYNSYCDSQHWTQTDHSNPPILFPENYPLPYLEPPSAEGTILDRNSVNFLPTVSDGGLFQYENVMCMDTHSRTGQQPKSSESRQQFNNYDDNDSIETAMFVSSELQGEKLACSDQLAMFAYSELHHENSSALVCDINMIFCDAAHFSAPLPSVSELSSNPSNSSLVGVKRNTGIIFPNSL